MRLAKVNVLGIVSRCDIEAFKGGLPTLWRNIVSIDEPSRKLIVITYLVVNTNCRLAISKRIGKGSEKRSELNGSTTGAEINIGEARIRGCSGSNAKQKIDVRICAHREKLAQPVTSGLRRNG